MKREPRFFVYDLAAAMMIVTSLPLFLSGNVRWTVLTVYLVLAGMIWAAAALAGHRRGLSLRGYLDHLREPHPTALDERRPRR